MDSLTDEIKSGLEKKRYSEMTPEEQRIAIYDQLESIPYNDLTEKPKPKMNIDFDVPLPLWVKVFNSFLATFFVLPILMIVVCAIYFPRFSALKLMWFLALQCALVWRLLLPMIRSKFKNCVNQPYINILQFNGYKWLYRLYKVEVPEARWLIFFSLIFFPLSMFQVGFLINQTVFLFIIFPLIK